MVKATAVVVGAAALALMARPTQGRRVTDRREVEGGHSLSPDSLTGAPGLAESSSDGDVVNTNLDGGRPKRCK